MKYELHVPDMSCEHCKMRISKVLEGLGEFEISLENGVIMIETECIESVMRILEEAGYPVYSYKRL